MKEKITISINECQVGMKTAEAIFNDYGAVIIAEGTKINDSIIKKLQMLGIENIKVFSGSDIEVEENSTITKQHHNIEAEESSTIAEQHNNIEVKENVILTKQYNNYIETVGEVIKDINSGKDLEMEKVEYVTNSMMNTFKDSSDIISCIKQVRNADEYTYVHCVNVSLLSMLMGKWLNLDQQNIKNLAYAGILHDIGKAKIDPAILNKPDKLTDEEYEEMKKHVLYGYRILEKVPNISKDIMAAVLFHHERENGEGYILKADGSKISLYAKVVAIADVYDAMTSNRVYRAKRTPFEVFEHIRNSAYGEFDPDIALVFIKHMANYFIGDKCMLNTGEIAEIMFIDPNYITKPIIKVGDEYIYLGKDSNRKIVELL